MTHRQALETALRNFSDPSRRERYLELYDLACVLHGYPDVEPGLAGIRTFYEAFWAAFPDVRITAEDFVEEGDKLACRFVCRATHSGPFFGVAATGRPIEFSGMTKSRLSRRSLHRTLEPGGLRDRAAADRCAPGLRTRSR